MDHISYHGTNLENAQKIIGPPTKVDVSLGKGELGKGFYTGSSIALAAIWAHAWYKNLGAVVEFSISKEEFVKLQGKVIKKRRGLLSLWNRLIEEKTTNTFEYGVDYVIAPFATMQETGHQIKFESLKAESTLNSSTIKLYPCA